MGEAQNPGPRSRASNRDHALRGMQRPDDTTPKGGPRRLEVASWTQTADDGFREKGNWRSPDEFAPGNWHQTAHGGTTSSPRDSGGKVAERQPDSCAHAQNSSIPAPSNEIARVAHLAYDDPSLPPPHSQGSSTALTATTITGFQTPCQPHADYLHADPREPVDATLRTNAHTGTADTPLRTPPRDLLTLRTLLAGQLVSTSPQLFCLRPSTPHEWNGRTLKRDDRRRRETAAASTETRLTEELASATWRRKLEELDSFDLVETLPTRCPQRHIPKSFQGPFRSVLIDMVSQAGDWENQRTRGETLSLCAKSRTTSARWRGEKQKT